MKTPIVVASATLVAIVACHSVAADTAGLKRCATIGSPLDRLACYDALARSVDAVPVRTPRASVAVSPPRMTDQPAPTPTPPPVRTVQPAPAPVAVATPEPANFGFEEKQRNESDEELTANYDGEFSGWSGQTLFKLDNGQVWRQSQSGRVSHRRSRPLITIKKGAFGSYRLSVEGLNKTIRVKRVK